MQIIFFILDKPVVSEKFFEEVRQVNLPVVWIDHHENNNIPDLIMVGKGKYEYFKDVKNLI